MLDILTHPLVEPYAKAAGLVTINQNNYTFITHQKRGSCILSLQICFHWCSKSGEQDSIVV
jgi:hypothetical protein